MQRYDKQGNTLEIETVFRGELSRIEAISRYLLEQSARSPEQTGPRPRKTDEIAPGEGGRG